jgi:hypothetical protein
VQSLQAAKFMMTKIYSMKLKETIEREKGQTDAARLTH